MKSGRIRARDAHAGCHPSFSSVLSRAPALTRAPALAYRHPPRIYPNPLCVIIMTTHDRFLTRTDAVAIIDISRWNAGVRCTSFYLRNAGLAGWLHAYGFCVGDCFFVFPLCGFSLSLFCNYILCGCMLIRFSTVWLLPFTLL